MNAASDLAHRRIGAASRLHRALTAVRVAGPVDYGARLGDVSAFDLEHAPLAAQCMALGATIFVGLAIPFEVAAR
ncbi:hypothetical protein D3C85_968680 [compost metagenome]